jgi:hypothetical protein
LTALDLAGITAQDNLQNQSDSNKAALADEVDHDLERRFIESVT